jgi:PhoH-like ATPase
MSTKKRKRKNFIIDTSVLLYDGKSIHSFPNNDVILPLVVLDELDRFKDKKGLVGENARYVNRYLDELRKKGKLHNKIKIENNQTIRVMLKGFDNVPTGLDASSADNQMISLALKIKENKNFNNIILVTKDINFRVKCDALGIESEDYYKDKIIEHKDEFYTGYSDVEIESNSIIDNLYAEDASCEDLEEIYKSLGRKPYENEYLCIKCGKQSFLGLFSNGSIYKLLSEKELDEGLVGVKSKIESNYML